MNENKIAKLKRKYESTSTALKTLLESDSWEYYDVEKLLDKELVAFHEYYAATRGKTLSWVNNQEIGELV